MTAARWIAALALAGLACRGDRGDRHDEASHGSAGHGGAGEAAGSLAQLVGAGDAPRTVRIDPDMIRDLRVTTARAETRASGERVSAPGELQVNQDAYAEVAAPSPARVERIVARAGDEVAAGAPLVVLHSADLGRARAEGDAAGARVDVARKNLERKRALAGERLVAEREVIEAEAALTEASAQAEVAAAALRQLGGSAGGSGLTLRAPVAGTIIDRDVVIGQLAEPSRTLYRIADLSTLWLVAHVFERDAVRVRVGGTGSAAFAALPGRTVDGTIRWIGREVDPSSRTIPVRLDIPNPDRVLRPGMSATVSIPLGDATGAALAVPVAAVQRVGDDWAVFVPRGEGVFEIRPIGRGRDLGGEVEILRGLAVGDEVVVDAAFLLKAEADKARGEGGHDHEH